MKNIEVVRSQQRLDNLFKKIEAFSGDIELQSHWAKYLCVLVSGFLETSVRGIYTNYAKGKASPLVANFVEIQLEDFQNPNMEKIIQVANSFNQQWADELRTATEGELKDAVDSIVRNRHKIAHGENIGLSYVTIKNYYIRAVKVIELLEQQCNR